MTRRPIRNFMLLTTLLAMAGTVGCFGTTQRTPTAGAESPSIPRSAKVVEEGNGTLDYTADADGTVFVQDARTEQLILTRPVKRGERLSVVPRENRIRLNDNTSLKTDLKRDNAHRIYLQRDARPEDETNNTRNGRDGVPIGARLIGQDVNNEISFKAARTGRAYIVDADAHKLVETLTVAEGKRFTFSPGADRATVDGKPVVQRDFDTKTNYRIYFDH